MKRRAGKSYAKRVADVNHIYDTYARTGLSNREIWRRYIYPKYAICEATFYNLLAAPTRRAIEEQQDLEEQGFLFPDLISPEEAASNPLFFHKTRRPGDE